MTKKQLLNTKPLRIKLRPYHPTLVVGYIGIYHDKNNDIKSCFTDVIDKIMNNVNDIEIEFVKEFDDICLKCEKRIEDKSGSVWGGDYTCPSAQDEKIIALVDEVNSLVFKALGLNFKSVIKFKHLVKLLAEKIPVLYDIKQRAEDDSPAVDVQKRYEKGLEILL